MPWLRPAGRSLRSSEWPRSARSRQPFGSQPLLEREASRGSVRRMGCAVAAGRPICLAVLMAALSLFAAPEAEAFGVVPAGTTCAWGSRLSADGGGRNLLFIDAAAAYWSTEIVAPPGATIRLSGEFPRARYMSLVTYDARRRTIDHLTDAAIRPDPGSANPFLPGAKRDGGRRSFSIDILDAPVPVEKRASNILYAKTAAQSRPGEPVRFTLRVYQPDAGVAFDDIAMPRIEIVDRGGRAQAVPPCASSANATDGERLETMLGAFLASRFRKMKPLAWAIFTPDGLGENIDNAYIYTSFDPKQGEVLAFRGRAPSAPATYAHAPVMGDGELRYWSFCTSRMTTAVIDCAVDEFVPMDDRGDYLVVVTTPEDRPRNAVPACGVAWLAAPAAGPGALVYRHMLPAATFSRSIQSLGAAGDPAALGDYLPRGRYSSKAEFEALGCPAPRS